MWCKISQTDDWGNIKTFIIYKENKIPVKDGKYKIKWPSGKVEVVKVKLLHRSVSVSDWGHSYEVPNQIPYIKVDHYGVKLDMELYKLKCKVWVD